MSASRYLAGAGGRGLPASAMREAVPPHGFRALYDAHAAALTRYARRIVRSPEAAEDVVQEVFLRLWLAWDRVEVGAGVRSYLYITTRARALNHLRRARVEERRWRAAGAHGAEDAPSRDGGGEARVRDGEIAAAVERVLGTMPPRQREAARLRLRRGLSTMEVARTLGISPRTVELHVARATRVLRARLPALLEGAGDAEGGALAREFDDAPMTDE